MERYVISKVDLSFIAGLMRCFVLQRLFLLASQTYLLSKISVFMNFFKKAGTSMSRSQCKKAHYQKENTFKYFSFFFIVHTTEVAENSAPGVGFKKLSEVAKPLSFKK